MRKRTARTLALGMVGLLLQPTWAFSGGPQGPPPQGPKTATPIQHLVVIFQENVSFDHYLRPIRWRPTPAPASPHLHCRREYACDQRPVGPRC